MTAPDLVAFLLARIAEDEDRARDFEHSIALAKNGTYGRGGIETWQGSWSAAERLGFLPDRVRAECDAKRRIVEEFDATEDHGYLCRLLALPYAAHPDYRQEWRP